MQERSLGKKAWDKQVGLAGSKEEGEPAATTAAGGVRGLLEDDSGIGYSA